jgi:hypothetical protein
VHVSRAHWSKSEGPTVARAIAERHFNNETYVLGIDSHCHFLRGWDNVGIDMFKRIGNDLAIISAYPPSYTEVCAYYVMNEMQTQCRALHVCHVCVATTRCYSCVWVCNSCSIIIMSSCLLLKNLQRGFGAESYDVNPKPRTQTGNYWSLCYNVELSTID